MRIAAASFVRAAFVAAGLALAPSVAGAEVLAGRVLDSDGKPVAGARVLVAESSLARILYASPDSALTVSWSEDDAAVGSGGLLAGEARTDASGAFSIEGLRAARFSMLVFEAERGFALRFDVPAAAEPAPLELTLTPSVALSIQLGEFEWDASRHLVELVALEPQGNVSFLPSAQELDDGSFRFGPLPAGRDWTVVVTEWVQERAFRATLLRWPLRSLVTPELRLGLNPTSAEPPQAYCIDPLGSSHPLAGVVLDADAEPLGNVSVIARSKADPTVERGAVTDASGRYAIQNLARGEWTLEARRWTMRRTAGCGVGPRDVHAAREVVLPLADPALANLQIERTPEPLHVGDPAPAFEARTLDGGRVALADLRGKVVLVDFWATWCALCRTEFPALRETYSMFGGGEQFEIVGVSIDEDPELVRRLTASLKLTWPQTALGPVEQNPLALAFNVAATPSSFLIDREGKIVATDVQGEALRAELAKLIRRDG